MTAVGLNRLRFFEAAWRMTWHTQAARASESSRDQSGSSSALIL
jgi:hypothetical protein